MVSLDQAWEAPELNRRACEAHAARAAAMGAELVVFPELTLTGFTMNVAGFAEDPADSPTIHFFEELARRHGVHLAFGVALRGAARPHNTMVMVDRAGREVARYAKVHPFTHAGEAVAYEGGTQLVTGRLDAVNFGFGVCYDLRFPGMFAAMAPVVDALLVIANWPERRVGHWQTLLRARAIEGQCCVVGVNRTGVDGNDVAYTRSSYAFGPDGMPLDPLATDDVIDIVALDAAAVRRYRQAFPVLPDARPELYRMPVR